ncbi:MAG TPA: hypothetical protein VGH28_06790 [Polyangiaceae bacterium]|jgi:hypothetical protein
MRRGIILGLATALVACGGRTTLDDSNTGDASTPSDGGIVVKDGSLPFEGGPPPPPPDSGPPPPPFDGGPPPPIDAGGPGGPIMCGNAVCNAPIETCCVTFGGQQLNESCAPSGQCQGASFDCSGAASCPFGEVCCGSFSQQSQGASCAPKCQGGFQNPQICETDGECPQGTTCKPSPVGFKVCRP